MPNSEFRNHGDKSVENGSGENAFDGAIGGRGSTGEADDLVDAAGEEAKRDDGGEELEHAEEFLEEVVGFRVTKLIGRETHDGW